MTSIDSDNVVSIQISGKEKAYELFATLPQFYEFRHALKRAMIPAETAPSIDKLYKFLRKAHDSVIVEIESNPWYAQEIQLMQDKYLENAKLDDEADYDPNYKVKMEDVFREVK